jgi:hypothetical protein
MQEADAAIRGVIEVDDFAAEELGPRQARAAAGNAPAARAEPRRVSSKRH